MAQLPESVASEFAGFRAVRRATLAMAKPLLQIQVDRTPPDGGWSIGEVLHHLLLIETRIRGAMRQLIEQSRATGRAEITWTFADNSTAPVWFPRAVLPLLSPAFTLFNLFLPRPLFEFIVRNPLLPFAAPDWARPSKGKALSDLLGGLEASINETEALLSAHADRDYAELILRHPSLGVNSVPQLLNTLRNHEMRHQEQIRAMLPATASTIAI